ncbi:MAG: DUF7948 domain-containing protein, partial [Armatimonadota bacterium]
MRLYQCLIFCLFISLFTISLPAISAVQKMNARVAKSYGKLPLSFVENKGQMDKRARFVIRGSRASAFFRNDGVTFDLWDASKKARLNKEDMLGSAVPQKAPKPEKRKRAVLKLTFRGADQKCRVEGMDSLPGKVNFMKGNDKVKWHTDVPTYKSVIYKNVWRGIDIMYRGDRRQLKYDIRVNPGADIRKVQLRYDGAQKMWFDKKGDLHIKTAVTEFVEKVPGIYQEKGDKQITVTGGYQLLDKKTVGFDVKSVDPSLPLVIDPASDLAYSTFLGGSNSVSDIAVDSSGCAHVIGSSHSSDFPTTPGAFDSSYDGGLEEADDVFVTKLNPSGSALVYSTFIGGVDGDQGKSISLDSSGCAYVAGYTWSSDFPTTTDAFDTSQNGSVDTFAAKLNPSGSGLEYSTFLGGSGADFARGLSVDSFGCAYVTGTTESNNFPTNSEAYDTSYNGGYDNSFITKLNPSGSGLVYSTFLDGGSTEGIAIDQSGCAYVTGEAGEHSNFPTTSGAFNDTYGGGALDAFIV